MSYEDEIRSFVVTSFAPDIPAGLLGDDVDLLDTGIVNSLGLLRLIAWVGDRYGIPVDELDISPTQFSSVTSIAAFVQNAHSPV
ncbi:phosphopantetheine-binding protein [Micromonospora schwarzwaldensis]|uniref:phosphopantetheine-binding protein n=1 Tax=Micromonospora sp. DSM 45708 TaxID=3111767 RepID=UPI0031D3DCC8